MSDHVRRRRLLAGALMLNLAFSLTVNLVLFGSAPLRFLATMTNNWLGPTLVVNVLAMLIIVGGWLMAVGKHSAASLGLRRDDFGLAVAVCAATWIAVQALAAVGQVAAGGALAGAGAALSGAAPALLGQLAGNAVYEETFYRGYLIRALTPEVGDRSGAAVLLAATVFGVMHIPNYWMRGLSLGFLVPAAMVGVVFGFLYLRTGNLWLCVGLHSLLNVPAALWDSPLPSWLAPVVALCICLALGPRLSVAGRRRSI